MEDIYLLKFGGNALDGDEGLLRLAREVASLVEEGVKIVIVHGGGPAISEEMERRGLKPVKVAGVRVTDEAGLEVAEKVLSEINVNVVCRLDEAGVMAASVPGYCCTKCRKKAPYTVMEDGKEVVVDLGLVGEVVDIDPQDLFELIEDGIVPVVYPIGSDGTTHLNVNADTMAAGIAAGIKCKEMIAITDVPGILRDVHDPSSKIDKVTFADIDALIADGTISGGMIPKVEACRKAVEAGAEAVRMVNGRDPDSIVTEVIHGASRGTLIVK